MNDHVFERYIAQNGHISSIKAISEKLRISTKDVRAIYDRISRDIDLYAANKPNTTDNELAELYFSGYSSNEIGILIGRTASAVAQRLRRMGVPMRPRFGRESTSNMGRVG
jgi:hypothetical protein